MSKIKFDAPTKLSGISPNINKKEAESPMIPDKIMVKPSNNKPTSFLLKTIDKERIETLLERAQPHITRKLSSSDVLRGILILAEKIDSTVLSAAIKETFSE